MKILFIGGTGTISSACAHLAAERGMELCLLNRGQTQRAMPEGVEHLTGEMRNKDAIRQLLGKREFDVVVDWIAFTAEHIETDLQLFQNRTAQYIFISSASVYQTPPAFLPVTESTPLSNPYWKYSQDKIACEQRLMQAFRQDGFPVTIVRPSHTYDYTRLPIPGQFTAISRMRAGKQIIVHGDGTSLWTLTHQRDFAKGFVGLLGNSHAIGESFHITSDEILTWNQIVEILARAAGAEARIVHIPSDLIAAFDAEWGAGLLGDKAHSMIFDNSKIKRLVPDYAATTPYSRGAKEILAWFDAKPERQVVDDELDQLMDRIIAAYESVWPGAKGK